MSKFYSLCIGSSMYSHNQRHRLWTTGSISMQRTEAPVTSVFELNIHNICREEAAVPVKRYEMDVEVGRYVCWDGTLSIKRLDSLSNPKLFPDELVPSSDEHWLSHSWNSHSHIISLHSLTCRRILQVLWTFWEVQRYTKSTSGTVNASFSVWYSMFAWIIPHWFPFCANLHCVTGVGVSEVCICREQVRCVRASLYAYLSVSWVYVCTLKCICRSCIWLFLCIWAMHIYVCIHTHAYTKCLWRNECAVYIIG